MKMSNKIAFVALTLIAGQALAALPTAPAPTRGASPGNFLIDMQNWGFDIAIFGGLLVATVSLFLVSKNMLHTYGLVAEKQATMSQFFVQGGIGVALLGFIWVLLNQAATIL